MSPAARDSAAVLAVLLDEVRGDRAALGRHAAGHRLHGRLADFEAFLARALEGLAGRSPGYGAGGGLRVDGP